ncbi:hypothetical protein B0H17DRAFT_1206059 [Mycena rosella]|uniref:Uncharacterized protein n=1 Tax=Mycena rosella TaxID=1033263 RepID=A0AAD7D7C4_MYCRO|nr:hypothetical protein B0H17DRAFT_1206059 [Mycena rosella]
MTEPIFVSTFVSVKCSFTSSPAGPHRLARIVVAVIDCGSASLVITAAQNREMHWQHLSVARDRGTYTVAPKTKPSQRAGLTLVGGKPMLMGRHPVVAAGRAGKTSSTTGATYAATEACAQISDARRCDAALGPRPPSYDAGLIARALQQTTRRVVLRESQTGMVVGITTGGSAAQETLGSRCAGASLCGNTGPAIGRKRRHNEDHANTEE